ncbi:MAG TPA: hypothetical protein VIM47_03450 [Dermatophilaceae bacterium]
MPRKGMVDFMLGLLAPRPVGIAGSLQRTAYGIDHVTSNGPIGSG